MAEPAGPARVSRRGDTQQASGPALPMAAAIADMRQFRAGFSIAEHNAGVLDRLVHLLSSRTEKHCQVDGASRTDPSLV